MATPIEEKGDGVHYLWHLEQIGCIGPENGLSPAWRMFLNGKLSATAAVAIIDNGCSLRHPNLPIESGAIKNPMEFASYINGAVYLDDPDPDKSARFSGLNDVFINCLGLQPHEFDDYLGDGISPRLRDTILGYLDGRCKPDEIDVPSPSERFGAHGTACAGLVAGRPEPEDRPQSKRNPSALDYFGVNPFATIIPIATVYSHAYWPLIMALLYAAAQKPDVILIPRAIEEMDDPEQYATHRGSGEGEESDPRDNGNLRDRERWAEKQLFEKLLADISEKIPTVVAAGNTGGPQLEYPAKCVHKEAKDLIVVGAGTANGLRATYSSGFDRDSSSDRRHLVTVYGPSDDRQETTEDEFRVFDLAWRSRRLKLDSFEGAIPEKDAANRYAPYGVLTLDVPGQYGYDATTEADLDFAEGRLTSDLKKELRKQESLPRALYTLFGGTSAACSAVAGLVSLLKATDEGKSLTGREIKNRIEDNLVAIGSVARVVVIGQGSQIVRTSQTDDQIPGLNLEVLLKSLGIDVKTDYPDDTSKE